MLGKDPRGLKLWASKDTYLIRIMFFGPLILYDSCSEHIKGGWAKSINLPKSFHCGKGI